MTDAVNPDHYKLKSGTQIIDFIRHLPFDLGNASKYCYRNDKKQNEVEDLKKAVWYLEDFRDNPVPVFFSKEMKRAYKSVLSEMSGFERSAFISIWMIAEAAAYGKLDQKQVRITCDRTIRLVEERLDEVSGDD